MMMTFRYRPILYITLAFIQCICIVRSESCNDTNIGIVSAERRLLKCLMADYDPAVRPVLGTNDTITVELGIPFMNVHELNSFTSTLLTSTWVYQSWKDVQLKWNPTDFDEVQWIQIPIKRLWNPDVTFYNAVDKEVRLSGDHVHVSYNGTVIWNPHLSLQTYCLMDLTHFPFDKQSCDIHMGTWAYISAKVKFHIHGDSSQRQLLNRRHEWHAQGLRAELVDGVYGQKHPHVQFRLDLTRVTSFYSYMFVGPSAVLALATLFVFLIPPGSGEKFIMCSGLLLCVILLLTLLAQYLPTQSDSVPVVAVYLAFNLVLLLIVEIMSILTLNFYKREGRKGKVPYCVRKIFLGKLSKLVCVSVPPYSPIPSDNANEEIIAERELRESFGNRETNMPRPSSPTLALEMTLEDIRRFLRVLAARADTPPVQTPHRELVTNEWQQVALVVDRLMFGLFFVITVVITLALYTNQ